jgi:hypothetical protein
MSAALTRYEEDLDEESIETFDLESLTAAKADVALAYARIEIERGRIIKRWEALCSGAARVRKREARNALDAFIPPVNLFGIEEAE